MQKPQASYPITVCNKFCKPLLILFVGAFFLSSSIIYANPSDKEFADTIPPKKNTSTDKITIEANNALIVTNGQSGGTNNVYVNRTPDPTVKLVEKILDNLIVTELPAKRPPMSKKIMLPSEGYPYDSLYKTTFVIDYQCPINLSSVMFWIKRNDVVDYDVMHNGLSNFSFGKHRATNQPVYVLKNPETGKYRFTLYTVNKFENPVKEIQVIK